MNQLTTEALVPRTTRQKPVNVSVYLPAEQKADLVSLASKSEMSLSEYVRAVLLDAIQNQDAYRLVPEKIMRDTSRHRSQLEVIGAPA